MSELDDFFVHTATVETLEGTDGYGREHFSGTITLSPTAEYGCFIEQKRRLVRGRDSQRGGDDTAEVISESTLYASPAVAALFTPGSRVTIRGAESRVIVASLLDSGDLDLPDHVAVALT
ncbi:hypothetical protein [Microbacterium allomyrinae]|uniref:Uncharacterized protein n=1 Tax=Microbacterium allomyrinae TaxID=2830666 RepID=A0A9X1S2V1_9MICO|nr:hypothetical protein [Microbacterium allomyrinae]MCC2033071.1 hypothetical protein [Microbacterium allomyrinae]